MIFKIDSLIRDKYPDLRIGVVCGKGFDNATVPAELESLKLSSIINLRERFTLKDLGSNSHIIAWRATYKSFGVKPKSHRPTAEALVRRILKGGDLPQISPIVDLYLVNELNYLLPIGGYDLDCISDFISLEVSKGEEEFLPIEAGEFEKTKKDEVIYRDSARILTRRWNWRDCDYAKITGKTQNFVLFVEAAQSDIANQDLEKATEELGRSLKRLKNINIKTSVFEPARNGLEIRLFER